jgi:hypothetical protein
MKQSNRLLILDSIINLLLGGLLIWYPPRLVEILGLPAQGSRFYAMILGGVLVGIGVALLIEFKRTKNELVGLGLGGAIAINLCGALALAIGSLSADLALTPLGTAFLWGLVILLGGISGLEWVSWLKAR